MKKKSGKTLMQKWKNKIGGKLSALDKKKLVLTNIPYALAAFYADRAFFLYRNSPGEDMGNKLLYAMEHADRIFAGFMLSNNWKDLLAGIVVAVVLKVLVWQKQADAKKLRKGIEYGSARWGTVEDIKPYMSEDPWMNIPLTATEALTMESRSKQPKYARNKNIVVIGGSGSGKTRFFVKPSVMQMNCSMVITDPKGTLIEECGKMLAKGPPKKDKNGNIMKDKSGKVVHVKTVKLKTVKKNQPTTVEITKSDVTTGAELDGAKLTVLDKEGNVVDQWTSVKDQPHVIKRLTVGEEYTLREEMAPYGYLKATDVKFTLEDTAEIQKVEMKDEVPTGLLIINKNGEFLDKVTLLDNVKGTVEHLFEYVTGSLTDVTFDVFAAEDIKAADGVSEDYFKADEKVGTITTDSNGIAQMGDLPAGKYYVKEVKTAHGYVLDKEPRYIDLSYRDQDTPVITYDEKWQNARQKVKVTVLKKEKDTERVLAGGVFGLYTSEDIKNAKGEVLLEKDSLIEQRVTDEKGQITFTADLPVDGKYYVKEIFAPDGFVTTEEVQEFTFEYAGEGQAEVSYDFTFENQPTTVELTKTDLTTGKELPGAHLKVTDSDGNTVDEWTSTEESHVIKELVVGKEYTMTETKPADGYVTAESISFTVENTAEVQKHEMKDDVTKVQISKTDITGETEIPGAKLTVLDKDDQVVESWTSTEEAHYIEKLPIGKYTLREEQAPKGYLMTADVTFEVKDTGEIQKVAMKDDTAKGKVILNKTDKSSGEPLKGVEFELRDSKGKVLETLKTDAAGHAESKLYESATFKNGKYDTAIKYYLVETKTLDGYTLDQTRHEVTFAYADDSTPVVEVTFNLTNEKPEVPETPNTPDTPQSHEETKVSNAPKTGDSTNIWLPILLLVISTGGMAGLYICRKRKSK